MELDGPVIPVHWTLLNQTGPACAARISVKVSAEPDRPGAAVVVVVLLLVVSK